jgi:membrane protease YdiL (CAAX protease family)
VSPVDQATPLSQTALGIEAALALAGLVLLWRLALSPRARRERAVRLPPWSLSGIDFLCFLCFAFVAVGAVSGLGALYLHYHKLDLAGQAILGATLQDGGILVGIYGFYALIGSRIGDRLGPVDVGGSMRTGLATFLIAWPIVAAVTWAWSLLLEKAGVSTQKQELLEIFEGMRSAVQRDLFVALAVIVVPAAEELLFRAGLFRYLRTRIPRGVAMLATSLLFAYLHGAWISLLPLAVLACIFCLAYERTGLIGTTIVAHALFNLNTVFMNVTGLGS